MYGRVYSCCWSGYWKFDDQVARKAVSGAQRLYSQESIEIMGADPKVPVGYPDQRYRGVSTRSTKC